jgi:hypothetical protein
MMTDGTYDRGGWNDSIAGRLGTWFVYAESRTLTT